MDKKSIVVAVVILALIVVGMFTFAFLKKKELQKTELNTTEQTTEDMPYPNINRIDAKHFFADGIHTIAGEIPFPTPCDLLETSAIVAESFPEQVTIDFNVINNSEVCAQVITAQRFKVSFNASSEASIGALFMNRRVELNLIEAGVDESPDDFELFIKG